jgi:4-hydroxybenzoate polyprenyltransferase
MGEQQVSALARVVWGAMRAPVALLLLLYAAAGTVVGGSTSVSTLLRAMLVVLPFLAFSAVVNDLADVRIDRVNLSADAQRVLAAGAAHRRHLGWVAGGSAVLTLLAGWSLGPLALVVAALGLALSTGYSVDPVRLARRGVLAPLALPMLYVAVPYLTGLFSARGRVEGADLPLLVALYLGFVGRIVLKDFRDVRGDALFGKRTFLVRHGRTWTCRFSAGFWASGAALLVWARPHATASWVLSTLAGTVLALVLLHQLAGEADRRREEWLVSALAVVGRGLLVVLLVDLAAPVAGAPSLTATLLVAGFTVAFGGQALQMRRHGPSRRPTRAVTGAMEDADAAHPLVR